MPLLLVLIAILVSFPSSARAQSPADSARVAPDSAAAAAKRAASVGIAVGDRIASRG
jgi:hypothetical protein